MAYLKSADILRDEDNFHLLEVMDYPQGEKKQRKKIFARLKSFTSLVKSSKGPISYGELQQKIKKAKDG